MNYTENMKNEILKVADGEEIIGIVIGHNKNIDDPVYSECWRGLPESYKSVKKNTVISWQEAEPVLDYAHNGMSPYFKITAWTRDSVIFCINYDDLTIYGKQPRNPIDHEPYRSGCFEYRKE
jgi:hypothetical protein